MMVWDGLIGYAANIGAKLGQFFFDMVVAPVDVINPVDQGFAIRDQSGQNQTG
jgi:hypothetical protein